MKIAFVASLAVTALSMSMALAQQQQPAAQAPASPPDLGLKVEMEPAAMAILKGMADKLAAAKSMSFTALTTFESPDRTGLPLDYSTLSQVTMALLYRSRETTDTHGSTSAVSLSMRRL